MNTINVLVVDDSAFMRKMISEILQSDPSIHVIATARNGSDGVQKAKQLRPDVITLDIEMPIMNGLEALREIMAHHPVPVVMLSSLTQDGADLTVHALESGAVDFVPKPSGSISLNIEDVKQVIIEKVKHAATANMRAITKNPLIGFSKLNLQQLKEMPDSIVKKQKKIVVIGVSTGGPRTLQKLLSQLPKNFPAPILIVQHMPARFTKSLAERLDHLTEIKVKEAEHGEFLQNGTAYIAPGNYHLEVKKLGMSITAFVSQTEPVKGHRPSVDKLFESIATLTNHQKIALMLTGMGSDGVHGLQQIKSVDASVKIMAESEESSIVFGMPKAAIKAGLVNQIVHIDNMGQALCKYMGNF